MIVWKVQGFRTVVHGLVSSSPIAYVAANGGEEAVDVFSHAMTGINDVKFLKDELRAYPCSADDLLERHKESAIFSMNAHDADDAMIVARYLRELKTKADKFWHEQIGGLIE